MGKVFVGGMDGKEGIFVCLDAATGKRLWQWQAPPREVPNTIDGFSIGIGTISPQQFAFTPRTAHLSALPVAISTSLISRKLAKWRLPFILDRAAGGFSHSHESSC